MHSTPLNNFNFQLAGQSANWWQFEPEMVNFQGFMVPMHSIYSHPTIAQIENPLVGAYYPWNCPNMTCNRQWARNDKEM